MRNYKFPKIPEATIKRLSIYHRVLNELMREGVEVISSHRLSELTGLNAPQIRKDLTYFGEFGVRGVGYFVTHLHDSIREILGINKKWNIILIGVGKLGQALLSYENFERQGYNIIAAFDTDPTKIGKKFGIKKITVMPLYRMKKIAKDNNVKIAIIATPSESAQNVLNVIEEAGIEGVINFAPVKLTPTKKNTKISYVDLVTEFDKMAFKITSS
ncbi:MAG: redox-sensing transcriptional repressor Rex [Proteobacteria bacterium]|nr:redox-sensing transcriptional repressor Rex [Pseudomonadota bacterium]